MATENDEQMEDEIKNFPHYSQFVDDASKLLSPPNDLPTCITIIGFEQLNEKCFCAFFFGLGGHQPAGNPIQHCVWLV